MEQRVRANTMPRWKRRQYETKPPAPLPDSTRRVCGVEPNHDLFLYAATQLGLAPAHCVVVEDAPVGVAAAIAAGMGSIGIGSPSRVGDAKLVLPNLIGVHLTELQTKLDHRALKG